MRQQALVGVIFALGLIGCEDSGSEVEISETRPLTTVDDAPKVQASSEERFLPEEMRQQMALAKGGDESAGGSGGGWGYTLPEGWRNAGAKPMREVNLAFGASGEVYLSVVGGGVEANAARWFRQFGAEVQALTELEKVSVLEGEGYLVKATGRYEPGMGRPGKDEQGLLGLLMEQGGRLVTVKMIGPADEVAGQEEAFRSFLNSLKRG
ncbi:MAG: hypothetical protein AAGC74_06590 [Verrucomicrobiota bacterium]